jgi:hypothetical protein
MAKLEVSDIARAIKGRAREVEAQLNDHTALSDELERLTAAEPARRRSALSRRWHPPWPAAGRAAHVGGSAKGHLAGEENQRPRAGRREQEQSSRR